MIPAQSSKDGPVPTEMNSCINCGEVSVCNDGKDKLPTSQRIDDKTTQ